MKVAYFVGPHSIRLIEEPCPNIQKPDEALVRMDCLGVCGSDAMRINGRNMLACKALIKDVAKEGETVTVEPILGLPVVKDLIVDMEA